MMKNKKYYLGLLSIVMSLSLLFGCNGGDENEPDPSEEPSEQYNDENN